MTLDECMHLIQPVEQTLFDQAQAQLNRLTKPIGSLGRLEEIAARFAAMRRESHPQLPRSAVFTFAADHGVAAEGVSVYPSEVTAQMVYNFLKGGAGVNVLAAHVGAEVRVVDIGVAHHFGPLPGLIHRKISHGTKNFLREPAMTRDEAIRALEVGMTLAQTAAKEGIGLIGTGDMGIGNTTPSTAITAVMTGRPVSRVTGKGTGLDDHGRDRKALLIEKALVHHPPDPSDPLDVLSKVGGFEIAGLAGLILGGAACRVPVVLDGFIAGAAALVASALHPMSLDYLIASHRSTEPGHTVILEHLGLRPLLDLGLRLGEGTGACLGIGLIQAALKIFTQMATFEEAGISGTLL